MSATICGHDRDTLRNRLITSRLRDEGLDVDGDAAYRRKLLVDRGHDAAKLEASAAKCAAIDADIYDPAKLAAMLAEEGRRLGLNVGAFDAFGGAEIQIWPRLRDRTICVDGNKDESRLRVLSMPQARVIFLQWLQLPNGAREEAERILRDEA